MWASHRIWGDITLHNDIHASFMNIYHEGDELVPTNEVHIKVGYSVISATLSNYHY